MEPKPYLPHHQDKLRFQSIFFATPDSAKGTSFLKVWPYDQHSFPDLYGYVPAFKRIRQFPTDQRFEPLIPGSTLYLSDAWTAGDASGHGHTGAFTGLGLQPGQTSLIATDPDNPCRSEEHTSELQSLMRISYAVFCLKKKNTKRKEH